MQQLALAVAALVLLAAGEAWSQPGVSGDWTASGRARVSLELAGGYGSVGNNLPMGPGLGFFAGLRPRDQLGFEVGLTGSAHERSVTRLGFFESESATRYAFQAAMTLFAEPPGARVQPYALVGVGHSWASGANLANDIFVPLGVGLRVGLGPLFLDGRLAANVLVTQRSSNADRVQAQLGLGIRL